MFRIIAGLLILASLVCAVQCFKMCFEDGRTATYTLDKTTSRNAEKLNGGMAFVRFATVTSVQGKFQFQPNTKVALKIAKKNCDKYLKVEDETYIKMKILGNGNKIAGIPVTEEGVGTSKSLLFDENLNLPGDQVGLTSFSIIVMERWGMDLYQYFLQKTFTTEDLLGISKKLNTILDELYKLGVAHGDIKPENILLNAENDPKGPIGLADFGLAVVGDHGSRVAAGSVLYASPAMMLTKRAATHLDDKFSGAVTIIILSSGFVPWSNLSTEYVNLAYTDKALRKYQEIAIMKAEFRCDGYTEYNAKNLPQELRIEIMAIIQTAAENDPQKNEIQETLIQWKKAVEAV